MKYLLILLTILLSMQISKGQIYISKNCEITFFSEAPLENIEAKNTTAKPILNTSNSEVAMRIPIEGFVFEKALMQEHFNENYMETSTYPYATFKGKVNEEVDYSKEGTHHVTISGKLDIHGVEKERTLEADLTINGEEIFVKSRFEVLVTDHNIVIPKVVFQNISEKILVKLNATLVPYKKK